MHDRLFENQMTLQNMEEGKAGATLNAFARDGLDMAGKELPTGHHDEEPGTGRYHRGTTPRITRHPTVVHGRGSVVDDMTPNMVLHRLVAGQRAGQWGAPSDRGLCLDPWDSTLFTPGISVHHPLAENLALRGVSRPR